MPILVRTDSAEFAALLEDRYGSFIKPQASSPQPLAPPCEARLDIDLIPPRTILDDEDVNVRLESGRWIITRGDFRAEFDPQSGHGWVRQSPNPYSIDGVLRILHSLFLARQGGFLVHAASAVRNSAPPRCSAKRSHSAPIWRPFFPWSLPGRNPCFGLRAPRSPWPPKIPVP